MKICGIIAEYNPFHNGHARHLFETRRVLGEDTAIVCAMSGNYVQRGDLAIMEKYRRAKAAVQSGADLVIELPLSASIASADHFALGAISTLNSLGCVTHLSFGSESGEIDSLKRAAAMLENKSVSHALQTALQEGLPYPVAMQRATSQVDARASALFASPNNTLGIAYCAALQKLNSTIAPITILRKGAAHDSHDSADNLPSASYLRSLLANTSLSACESLMPTASYAVLSAACDAGEAPNYQSVLDLAMLAHLRRLSPSDLLQYCGGADGLEHRLYAAIKTHTSFSAICSTAQTRRYPLARIRRALMRAWLELPINTPVTAQYHRILAANSRGQQVLRRMKETCTLPVILKPVTEQYLPEALQPSLQLDARADDLYTLAMPRENLGVGGEHFRKTPYFSKNICEN